MKTRRVGPAATIAGTVTVPGDKSVSHRALILAAMAAGTSHIQGLAAGADVSSTAACLAKLGAPPRLEGGVTVIRSPGWLVAGHAELQAGNSGTTMRLLSGALAGRSGRFRLTGDTSLNHRPMDRVAAPLREMGAEVTLRDGRYPPVLLKGSSLRGISYRSPVASAQVKGAVVLAALQAEGRTQFLEPAATRDHTERLLTWLGTGIVADGLLISIEPPEDALPAFDLTIPGDLSSAAFLIAAAVAIPGGRIEVTGVGLNPSRTAFLDVLGEMGAGVAREISSAEPEPAGTVAATAASLGPVRITGARTAAVIDEIPLIALLATQADGTTVVEDAEELRLKESDRLSVLAQGLRALGARVEETPSGLAIEGPTPLSGGTLDPSGDHRIALTFAIAGLIARAPVEILGWECTEVSYPGFLDTLSQVIA